MTTEERNREMHLSKPRFDKERRMYYRQGKYLTFTCRIYKDEWDESYFYIIKKDGETSENSLWCSRKWATEENCRMACEEWCKKHREELK